MARRMIVNKKKKMEREEKSFREMKQYTNGAEGMISWCEKYCHAPVYKPDETIPEWIRIGKLPRDVNPETGKSYWWMWEEQKEELREALKMVNGRFVYNLIIFCWPRGEGKSFITVLIQLWRFFNWPR